MRSGEILRGGVFGQLLVRSLGGRLLLLHVTALHFGVVLLCLRQLPLVILTFLVLDQLLLALLDVLLLGFGDDGGNDDVWRGKAFTRRSNQSTLNTRLRASSGLDRVNNLLVLRVLCRLEVAKSEVHLVRLQLLIHIPHLS